MLPRGTLVGLLAFLASPVFANEPPRFDIRRRVVPPNRSAPRMPHPTRGVCETRTRPDPS